MKKTTIFLLFFSPLYLFSQNSWVKVYTPDRGIQDFKVIKTNDPSYKFIGLITDIAFPLNYNVGNSYTTVAYYNFQKDSTVVMGGEQCGYVYCHGGSQELECGGMNWLDIAPYHPSLDLISTWDENDCPTWYGQYSVKLSNCQVQYESGLSPSEFPSRPFTTQSVFFHPTDSTILYRFDTAAGLLISHFSTCPQNWQTIKSAKNPSYLLVVPEHPNIMFLTADDTLWHSNDSGQTWNMAVAANINSVSYYPDLNIFVASSFDSASSGAYRSVDSGKTFILLNHTPLLSVTIDTTDNAVYAGVYGALLRSNDTGRTLYVYNNSFTRGPVFSATADVYGNVVCGARDGVYKVYESGVAPYLLSPANDTIWVSQPVKVTWDTLTQSKSYRLQVALDTNFTTIIVDDTGLTSVTKQLEVLQTNTRYFWRVRAVLTTPATPIWSQTWSFTTLPLLPTQTELIAPHNDTILYKTRVDFSWNADKDAPLHYWFEIADNDSLKKSYIDSTLTDTTVVLYEPLVTQTYWWRVRAQNAVGWGPFSPLYHFTMLGSNDVAGMNAPVKSGLIQNYPNPFTSSTLIRIPAQTQVVSLKIYDALGREVADLSAEARSGSTSIPFDGSRLPAGVYVCRMQEVDFVSSKLMVLEK
jgi:hypothetical protein